MELRLYLPQYNELFFREQLLSDPQTMAFNRFKEPSPQYHPETGCIDFPRRDWALWYGFWMEKEPDNFYAILADGRTPVGEVSWYFDGENYNAGIILLAKHRNKGYCAPALKLLAQRAFEVHRLEALSVSLSTANAPAVKGFTKAGFRRIRRGGGTCLLRLTRKDWESQLNANASENNNSGAVSEN